MKLSPPLINGDGSLCRPVVRRVRHRAHKSILFSFVVAPWPGLSCRAHAHAPPRRCARARTRHGPAGTLRSRELERHADVSHIVGQGTTVREGAVGHSLRTAQHSRAQRSSSRSPVAEVKELTAPCTAHARSVSSLSSTVIHLPPSSVIIMGNQGTMSGTRALRSAEVWPDMRFLWRWSSLHCTSTPSSSSTSMARACGHTNE